VSGIFCSFSLTLCVQSERCPSTLSLEVLASSHRNDVLQLSVVKLLTLNCRSARGAGTTTAYLMTSVIVNRAAVSEHSTEIFKVTI